MVARLLFVFFTAVCNLLFVRTVLSQQLRVDPSHLESATPVIYEIRIPTVASTVVKAYDLETNDILVPVGSLMDLFRIAYQIDYSAATVKFNKSTLAVIGNTTVTDPDSVYVFLSTIARHLNLIVNVNRGDALITVSGTEDLPVVKILARERARKLLARPIDEFATYESILNATLITPSSGFGSVALDYHFSHFRARSTAQTAFSVNAATPILQGTLISRTSGFGTRSHTDLSWLRAWPLDDEPTQLRVGSTSATGLGAVPIYGLSISNAPWSRPQGFNVMNVTGVLPPDWSLEAYRDGMLVGFDSVGSGGNYELPIPINYGENSLKLVAYGPRGETMSFIQIIRARPGMLPKGAFEFAGSTGACARGMCSWMMNTDIRYGLSPKWTVNAGASEYSWHSKAPTTVHPYVSVDGIVRQGLTVSAGAMKDSYLHAGFAWDPSSAVSVMGDYYKFRNTEAGKMTSGGIADQAWAAVRLSPKWLPVPIEMQSVRTSSVSGTHTFMRVGTNVQFNQTVIRPYLRGVHSSGQGINSYVGVDAVAMAASFGLPRLNSWWLRGNVEASVNGEFEHVEVVVAKTGRNGFSAEAGVKWHKSYGEPRITLGFSRDLGGVRINSNTHAAVNGEIANMNYSASGAVRWNNSARALTTSAYSSSDQSGVSGFLFVDENDNNKLDAGEMRIPNAIVRVDGYSATTDQKGYFEIWGLAGGKVVKIEIEAGSLESPWWVPVISKAYVPTSPYRSVPINVPFTTGGVIEGEIRTANGGFPPTVKVRHIKTRRIYSLEPFSDGTFYQMGMLPGEYEVILADEKLKQGSDISVAPATFAIRGGESNTVVFTITLSDSSD